MNAFGNALGQDRVVRGCAEATAGYAVAATAAYTSAACQMLDFWSLALSGLTSQTDDDAESIQPVVTPAPVVHSEPSLGLALEDWSPFSWFDARRFEPLMRLDFTTHPVVAMMACASAVPLRGSPSSWPIAHVMIESGVPRAVAWPAAEANAAALDAVDAATQGLHSILASYHTESGYATVSRSIVPSALAAFMMMSIATVPINGSLVNFAI